MNVFLTPLEATILFLLFDAFGWCMLFLYDSLHRRRVLPYLNSLRLLVGGSFTIGMSYCFYNFVPGATALWFLLAHGFFFIGFPMWLFYSRASRSTGWFAFFFANLSIMLGIREVAASGLSPVPLTVFYALANTAILIFFRTGYHYAAMRYYFKRPFWH